MFLAQNCFLQLASKSINCVLQRCSKLEGVRFIYVSISFNFFANHVAFLDYVAKSGMGCYFHRFGICET